MKNESYTDSLISHLKYDTSFLGYLITLSNEEFGRLLEGVDLGIKSDAIKEIAFVINKSKAIEKAEKILPDIIKNMTLGNLIRKKYLDYIPQKDQNSWTFKITEKGNKYLETSEIIEETASLEELRSLTENSFVPVEKNVWSKTCKHVPQDMILTLAQEGQWNLQPGNRKSLFLDEIINYAEQYCKNLM